MLLSIIIPVYNGSESLDRCLGSIVAQSIEMEIILIDDGSTDATLTVCDQWAYLHPFIHVVHQPNLGLSMARNHGLALAKGRWVTFVDADDAVAPNTYAPLMNLMAAHPEWDILEYPAVVHFQGVDEHRITFANRIYDNVCDAWMENQLYTHCYAWNKIYRRDFLPLDLYPQGRNFEDVHAMLRLMKKNPVYVSTDIGEYKYYSTPSGITYQAKVGDYLSLMDGHEAIYQWLMSLNVFGNYSDKLLTNYFDHLMNIEITTIALSGANPRKIKYLGSMKYSKYRIKRFLLHLVGIRFLGQLVKNFG